MRRAQLLEHPIHKDWNPPLDLEFACYKCLEAEDTTNTWRAQQEARFDMGVPNEKWVGYYNNGNLESDTEYDQGRPIGEWRFFDKNAVL